MTGRRAGRARLLPLASAAVLLGAVPSGAQPARATVREYQQSFPTYPFNDPNPVPVVGRIYPYFRFDGFSATAVDRKWKIVALENAYIKVLITPEIGGKIWAAIEKKSGRPFIYYNHAVKFRDIAMRGPWTSGGIEANYGIIGHTPNVSTPVDYVTRTNSDGSVSCITGALDLLTLTRWQVETRLAPDRAAFTTTSTWHNTSSLEQPYYHWMTAGIPVQGKLQYVFPGTSYIGHAGEKGEWPLNTQLGRDVSWYDNNDFGGYKSYHVTGGTGDFFGAFWHDQNLGMARVAPRDEKPGQKIWIWGLSRQGMVWEQLLTDTDGQYSELQSGRLFNQSEERSTFTPFKHRGFAPHLTDRWTEQWQPVIGTKGFVVAGRVGAMNVTRAGDRLIVAISPVEAIDDSLVITVAGKPLHSARVRRAPLALYADTIPAAGVDFASVTVTLGDHKLDFTSAPNAAALDRPIEAPSDFDWSSGYGLYLKGKELLRQREYARATALLDSALVITPHFVPALADRAALALRSMDYDAALRFGRSAIAVDAHDGAANYHYGLANRRLGRIINARDGLEIATQSAEYRVAAYTELAKLWLAGHDDRRATHYADQALAIEPANLDALGVRVVSARRAGRPQALTLALAALRAADPLGQLARFEELIKRGTPDAGAQLMMGVRSELPEQALFELAAWYQDVGEAAMALRVLEGVGEHPEAHYWRASLVDTTTARALVERASRLSPRMVFPFRPEVIGALRRATAMTLDWKPSYYLALGLWAVGDTTGARRFFTVPGQHPDFAPFYAVRATFPGRSAAEQLADLARASTMDSTEWRYGKLLAERQLATGDAASAVATTARYVMRFPRSYILGLSHARMLLAAGRHGEASALLDTLVILPYEGAAEGHALYREAKLLMAVDAIRDRRWDQAAALITSARAWPERLGAGRPYDADVDERLENALAAELEARRAGGSAPAQHARLRALAADGGMDARVVAYWLRVVP